MAIALRGSDNGDTGIPPLTLNKPAGTVEGDLILITHCNDSETSGTPPAGFATVTGYPVDQPIGVETTRLEVFYKVAGASEPATYDITGFSAQSSATIEVYYDTVGGGTWTVNAAATGNGTTSATAGPVTSTNNSRRRSNINYTL